MLRAAWVFLADPGKLQGGVTLRPAPSAKSTAAEAIAEFRAGKGRVQLVRKEGRDVSS